MMERGHMARQFDQEMSDQLDQMIVSDPKLALVTLRKMANEYGDQTFFHNNYGARLLDTGKDLRNSTLIKEGISKTRKVLDQVPIQMRNGLLTNIASSYVRLHIYDNPKSPVFDLFDSDNLSSAKEIFDGMNGTEQAFDSALRGRYFVEFGNCLSEMGRYYEAIRLYEHALQANPNDPVAITNLGLSFHETALIADDPEVLREATETLGKALATNALDTSGGAGTSQRIREFKEEIDAALGSYSGGRGGKIAVEPASYQGFCKQAQLFLNFCFHTEDCPHIPADTVTFALADVKDENKLITWSRTINEIKQQFAVARLLLFEAMRHPYETQQIDELTTYSDLRDFSVYGVRSGKVKIAYQTLFNLLDKIGFFLNAYLSLGISDKDVSFRSVWKDAKRTILPQLSPHTNSYLRALYEISKELPSLGHFGMFTDMRNLLTHRYFVLHTKAGDWRTAADGDECHAGYGQFSSLAFQLLGLAKASIIYLIAFVRSNESKNVGTKREYVRLSRYSGQDLGPIKSEI
jgi:tetratricopeptide (TPR) repeat protein